MPSFYINNLNKLVFFSKGYVKIYGENQKERAISLAKQIIKDADSNDSGAIDFTEFLIAAMNEENLLNKNKMEQAFKMFDAVIFFFCFICFFYNFF